MANLSWLFFKGYYQQSGWNAHWWTTLKTEVTKKATSAYFEKVNGLFKNEAIPVFGEKPVLTQKENSRMLNSEVQAYTTYPGLLIGSGYTHETGAEGEFKIGFHLDYTTGMPIIPGSSVKGALRAIFPQFEGMENTPWIIDEKKEQGGKTQKEIDENKLNYAKKKAKAGYIAKELGLKEDDYQAIHKLELEIFTGLDIDKSQKETCYYSLYLRDIFHDAYPLEAGKEGCIFGTDSITPHIKEGMSYQQAMLKNPVPLLFLKVLPNVRYEFRFQLTDSKILSSVTARQKEKLFTELLLTFGVGAKTNVGYGQFSEKKIPPAVEMAPEKKREESKINYDKTGGGGNKRNKEEKVEPRTRLEMLQDNIQNKVKDEITVQEKTDWPEASLNLKITGIEATVIAYAGGINVLKPHYKNSSTVKIQGKALKINDVVKIIFTDSEGSEKKGNLRFTKAKLAP